jgi:hypothetical protein
MRWTRRRVQTIATWVVVVGWAVFYAVALAHADPLPAPDTAVMWLVVPPLLWCSPYGSCCATGGLGPGPTCRRWTCRGGCSRPRWRHCPSAGASGVGR